MARRILGGVLALALFCAEAVCAGGVAPPGPGRRGVVEALLGRSRLLRDVHFSIPVALWRRHRREAILAAEPERAPVSKIVESVVFDLSVSAAHEARLAATVTLRVFDPEKCRRLGLLDARYVWREITVNDEPARPAARPGERLLRLSPPRAGVYVLKARTPALPKVGAAGGSIPLRFPKAVRTHVRFSSPRAWEVSFQGDSRSLRGGAAAGTRGLLALGSREEALLVYRPPAVRFRRPTQYRVRGAVAWNLGVGAQEVTAKLDVAILGDPAERIGLLLGPGARRVKITGPDVREVRPAPGGATVHLQGRIRDKTALNVSYERPPGRGVRTFRRPELADGHWVGGTLVITNSAGGSEVVAESAAGLDALVVADIPDAAGAILAGPAVLAYRITGRRWAAAVDVIDLGEFALRQSIADLAHYELTFLDDGTIFCKVRYEIRNRARQYLRTVLPPGAVVLQARVNDVSEALTPVASAPDAWRLPLVRSKASVEGLVSFPVEVVYLCRVQPPSAKGRAALPLPRIDLPIAYAWCQAYLPEGMKVERWTGPMRAVKQYAGEAPAASLDYGHGELADGYRRPDRPIALRPKSPTAPSKVVAAPELKLAPLQSVTLLQDGQASYRITKRSLGRNYWKVGKDYYARNDYDNAVVALNKTVQLAPGSPEAANAKRLLANIDMVQGKLRLRGRAQKTGATLAQKEVAAQNVVVARQQEEYLELGRRAIEEGREADAQSHLFGAEQLGVQLIRQGAGKGEQAAKMRRARGQLKRLRELEKAEVSRDLDKVEALARAGKRAEALATAQRVQNRFLLQPQHGQAEEVQKQVEALAAQVAATGGGKTSDGRRWVARRGDAATTRPAGRGILLVTDGTVRDDQWSARGPRIKPDGKERIVRAVYDVNALVVRSSNTSFAMPDGARRAGRRREGERIARLVRDNVRAGRLDKAPKIVVTNGRMVVTAAPSEQRQVANLLKGLGAARGAQVQRGTNIAGQQVMVGFSAGDASGNEAAAVGYKDMGGRGEGSPAPDPEVERFIADNYEWALDSTAAVGYVRLSGGKSSVPILGKRPVSRGLAGKLRQNLGQAVGVSSVNVNTDRREANRLGARFRTAPNGTVYAVVDEAQLRTLLEMEGGMDDDKKPVPGNRRRQETIVGTDALLANDMRANVTFAADRGNTLAVNGDAIDLPHQRVLLIDNGRYLTVVKAGEMHHWRQTPAEQLLIEVPQDVRPPRVGRLVKFEKTLVEPGDDLVLRAEYFWEGDAQ